MTIQVKLPGTIFFSNQRAADEFKWGCFRIGANLNKQTSTLRFAWNYLKWSNGDTSVAVLLPLNHRLVGREKISHSCLSVRQEAFLKSQILLWIRKHFLFSSSSSAFFFSWQCLIFWCGLMGTSARMFSWCSREVCQLSASLPQLQPADLKCIWKS